ncbi:hypothetical protein NPX13_g3965 [Xylaria arbuscula]|uniref:Heterokaryon incompatibility domain-containing protein n=1 Tax=Xylaria arbuscula TaxID=114810 RepID=A0A9W8NGB7_9PEZI|nr:hypothetical protein NPX13_g3965 [Xylaria arbuscula]
MHPPLWVLDTWKQCLVQCSTATPYVALSYVWGGSATLTALKDNIESLKIPGSLAEGNTKIPKTIRDAMAFVQILGERYLWVDSLCIVQDGPQKMVEVANMGVIYAQASITIVAADGDNANAGLRGLHGMSGPRSVRQVVHSLGRGASLIETHGQRIAATTSLIWKTRGWTFQEDLFSRRKVIFEKGWVRWECHEATWDEHSNANMPQPSIFDTLVPDVDYLNGIINDFNERILTFPEDALLAFSGIASALSGVFQGGFISGLPVSLLHVGLLWIPTSTSSRRLPKKAVEGVCLPSWSWAGWQGGVSLPAGMVLGYRVFHSKRWTQYTRERVSSLVEWSWANSPQGKKNRIRESWHDYREAFWNKSDTPCPPGWTRYSIRDPSSMPADDISTQPRSGDRPLCLYKHDSEHDLLFWYPPPMPQNHEPSKAHNLAQYISCRTRRGWLLLGEAIVRPMGISQYIPVVSLRDQRGTWAGALTLHEPMHNDQENDNRAGERQSMRIRLELVEIAQGNIPNDPNDWKEYIEEWKLDERPKSGALYEYFYVLWIEWKEGIAYRKGIGRVHKDTWEAQQLEWIDLVLG